MTLTARDRKIMIGVIPVVVLVAYWFLVLGPKRHDAADLGTQLAHVQTERDQAVSASQNVETAKATFASDLSTLVRVGKAIPTDVDMPSLIVQLSRAAQGTHIAFDQIKAGARTGSSTAVPSGSSPPTGNQSTPASSPSGAAAPGGATATTGAGKVVEKAGNAKQNADATTAASGGETNSGSSSQPSGSTAAPSTASGTPGATPSSSSAPGLDTVPLQFTFKGSFFDLADFFHRLKRFVWLSNRGLKVRGRLMTVDSLSLTSDRFPGITAQVNATVYLAPKGEGQTAGATPQGPATGGGQPSTVSGTGGSTAGGGSASSAPTSATGGAQ